MLSCRAVLIFWLLAQLSLCGTASFCPASANVTAESGEIVSHYGFGSASYTNSMNCNWQINIPSGLQIRFWFSFLSTEGCCDKIFVTEVGTGKSIVNALSGGTGAVASPKVYESMSSAIKVKFVSDGSVVRDGFKLHFKATKFKAKRQMRLGNQTVSRSWQSSAWSDTCFWGRSLSYEDRIRADPSASFMYFTSESASRASGGYHWLVLELKAPVHVTAVTIIGREDFPPLPSYSADFYKGAAGIEIWTSAEDVDFTSAEHCSAQDINKYFNKDQWTLCGATSSGPLSQGASLIVNCTVEVRVKLVLLRRAVYFTGIYDSDKMSFSGVLLTLSDRAVPDCNGVINLTTGAGEIARPLSTGSMAYLPNKSCYWQLNAPAGRRAAVWFTYNRIYCCGADRMSFYDGVNGSSTVIASGTNYFAATKFVSSSNTLTVYHYSDPTTGKPNSFRLRYEAVDNYTSTGCAPINYTSITSGVIVSHANYGSNVYPPSTACSWTLPPLPGYYINLQVTSHLARGDCLSLTSNATSGSSPNTTYCGWSSNSVNLVMAGSAQIAFTSDGLYESYGFSVRFDYFYPCPSLLALTADSGEIQSHTGAGTLMYLNNMQCNWLISVSPGKQVIAWLTLFSMNDGGDNVTLYDGISGTNALANFRGSANIMQGFTSSTNFMRVSFGSDSSGTALGFKLSYSTADKYCRMQQTVTGSGEIVSHSGYGVTKFLGPRKCIWNIIAPTDNNVVARFTFFSLDPTANAHRVNLYDGPGQKNFGIFQGFHNDSSTVFITRTNTMRIEFSSDSPGNSLGFRLEYTTNESYCRGIKYVSGDNGEVVGQSPTDYRGYSTDTDCIWVITVPVGKRVLASFTFLNLNNNGYYSYVYIRVFDGTYDVTLLAEEFSYLSLPSSSALLTSGNVLSLSFRGSSGRPSSFRLRFNATDSYCLRYLLIQGGSGEISSQTDAGVSHYLNNMTCTWQIIGETQFTKILASFKLLDLNSSGDTVTLLDGPSENPIITVRGGNASLVPTSILTITNILTVRFATDLSGTGLGFRLSYNAGSESPVTAGSKPGSSQPATETTGRRERPSATELAGRLLYTMGSKPSTSQPTTTTAGRRERSSATKFASRLFNTMETLSQASKVTIAIAVASVLLVLAVTAGLVGYFLLKRRRPTPVSAMPILGADSLKTPGIFSSKYKVDVSNGWTAVSLNYASAKHPHWEAKVPLN